MWTLFPLYTVMLIDENFLHVFHYGLQLYLKKQAKTLSSTGVLNNI